MKPIGKYVNGDYTVGIFEDGTKVRFNDKDAFYPVFPESMDIKITNQCEIGCKFCHEDSKPDGEHGDIMNAKFIETLHPYTELAIGGGNPLAHPNLEPFLEKCKSLKLIPNLTVNQFHFEKNYDTLKKWTDDKLVYGLGVSATFVTNGFLNKVAAIPNGVIHVIAGVATHEEMEDMYDKGLKVLILGYKNFRRGKSFLAKNKDEVDSRLESMEKHLTDYFKHFEVVSFDNLAIEQLKVKDKLPKNTFDAIYMGDDGQFTMYVDMVKCEFAKSSTSTQRWSIDGHERIETMFDVVRRNGQ